MWKNELKKNKFVINLLKKQKKKWEIVFSRDDFHKKIKENAFFHSLLDLYNNTIIINIYYKIN